jgi:DNA-binding CsgD family transcriptional regulator
MDPSAATGHLRTAIELAQEPVERARIALDLLHACLWTDRVEEAVSVAHDTIEALEGGDPELVLQLEAEVVAALRTGVATSPLADERLDRWRGRVEGRTPAERLLLVHLAVRTGVRGGNAEGVAALAERALGGGRLLAEQSAESLVPYLPLYQLMCADRRLDLVESCLADAMARARASGSLLGLCYASIFRSHLECMRGNLADAEADALQALGGVARMPGWQLPLAGVLDAVVAVLVERGKLDEADTALTENGLTGALGDSVPARILLASRGHLRVAQGRTREGLADLLELVGREERTGTTNLFLTPYRSLAALALARLGETDRAVALSDEAVAQARTWGAAPQLGTALRHAGIVHGGSAGLQRLREAADLLDGSSARLAHASALVELGSALRRTGRRSESLDPLRKGLDLAHRCGARPLESRARQELLLSGARPRRPAVSGVESLTPSERRVCQLAAQGLTNLDIAQALFVTLRTVEIHLTHAYQKLQITSRRALTELLPGSRE